MTLPLSFYIALICLILGFGGGFYTEFKLTEASKEVQESRDLKAAQAGEVKIIHDTQVITKVIHDSKDTCSGTPVPAAINRQL